MTLQALLLCLPDVNRRCLRLVLSLLYSVARAQEENKMTATSLATVFLPALLPQGKFFFLRRCSSRRHSLRRLKLRRLNNIFSY